MWGETTFQPWDGSFPEVGQKKEERKKEGKKEERKKEQKSVITMVMVTTFRLNQFKLPGLVLYGLDNFKFKSQCLFDLIARQISWFQCRRRCNFGTLEVSEK